MADRYTGFGSRRFGFSALATLVLSAWSSTRAQPSQVDQLALQPAAPRHSDALPQPPTPTPEPQEQQPPRIHGERPGYWQSPESVYPWQYPYRPGFYPYGGYHRWNLEAPPAVQPPYHLNWNRRWGRVPRYRRWRF